MSGEITFRRSVDIEDEVRKALKDYLTAYCKPLPANFQTPCITITQVGGTNAENQIDTFDITLDARDPDAGEANETLRNAVGILKQVAKEQTTPLRHVEVETSGAWGNDPARPELSMYSARLRVVVHTEQKTLTTQGGN